MKSRKGKEQDTGVEVTLAKDSVNRAIKGVRYGDTWFRFSASDTMTPQQTSLG